MQDALAPVTRQSLADRLARQIRRLIQSAGYQVGDRLPTIMDMAHQFTTAQTAAAVGACGISIAGASKGLFPPGENG